MDYLLSCVIRAIITTGAGVMFGYFVIENVKFYKEISPYLWGSNKSEKI